MMTLLNEVRPLVRPYLTDEMQEIGTNEYSVDEGNMAIDIECEHYVDYTDKLEVMHAVIEPKKVHVSFCDEDGNYGKPIDLTKYFSEYKYKVFN